MASIIWNEKKNKRFEVAKRRLKKGFWHFFFVFFPFRLHSSSSCLLLYTIHVSIAPASEKKAERRKSSKFFFSFLSFQWNRIMRATSWMETYNQEKSSKKKFFFFCFNVTENSFILFYFFLPYLKKQEENNI